MRIQVEQTVLKCDGCGDEITAALHYDPNVKRLSSIKNIDLCPVCSMNILEDVVESFGIDITSFIDEYKASYRCPKKGIILC